MPEWASGIKSIPSQEQYLGNSGLNQAPEETISGIV